jgi:ATP-dependent DNA helicase RecG
MANMAAIMAYGGFEPYRAEAWPTRLTLEEFAERFPSESDTIEFKQGLSAIQESAVAFSNTLGGVIVAGVRNDGSIQGLRWTPAVEDKIRDQLASAHALAPVFTRGLDVGAHQVTLIGVGQLREGFAQTSNGRVLVRVGTRRPALIGAELVRFMQDRMSSSFESVPTDVAYDEADPQLVAEVAAALGITSGPRLKSRLQERGLVCSDSARSMLSVAGVLYLTPRPERTLGKAYIEVRRSAPGDRGYDRRDEICGPLHQQVAQATAAVMHEVGSDIVVLGLRRHDLPRLPERVVRETIANAVAHRSYEQRGTPIRIDLYRDRTEVTSPGGLVAPVTLETMRDAYAARNTDVIRVLRAFGLAEDSGRGVDIIQDVMRDELLATPTFVASDARVSVSLPVLGGTRPEERAWLHEIVDRGEIEERDRVILVHARRGEVLSNSRVRDLLGIGRDAAMGALRRLVAAGLLERSGRRGGTRYQLARDLAPPAGLRLARDELLAVIVAMAEEAAVTQGAVLSNATIRNRLGLDSLETLSLLNELVEAGRLQRVGERRGTHYVPLEASKPKLSRERS